MLSLCYSNRYEILTAALLDDLGAALPGPWERELIIVPSLAIRRRLELDLAAHFGVCANVDFCYLAQWLWHQIGKLVPVSEASPFSAECLVWRCYRLLDQVRGSARLAAYLDSADDAMRYELARRIAMLFGQYLTYRPEWLSRWQYGVSLFAPASGSAAAAGMHRSALLHAASQAQRADEAWQAKLWRAVLRELMPVALDSPEAAPAAYRFLAQAPRHDLAFLAELDWPARVSVFAAPNMPPLHIALLRELSRWIDVRLYVLNPCSEYWFDITSEAHLEDLDAAGRRDYHETGHPLLAEWGRQTQAYLRALYELTETAGARERAYYVANPRANRLAALQNAILTLRAQPEVSNALSAPKLSNAPGSPNQGIEIHACHSLSRQIEVLHDRLLAHFDADPSLRCDEVLVALPDLAAAAPFIDAVFGTMPPGEARRIPYRITGLPVSRTNSVARMLLDLLDLGSRTVRVTDLIEWLRVDALARRYGIEADQLETIQSWLAAAGARRGMSPPAPGEPDRPMTRHTFDDALTRLLLGYVMPDRAEPVEGWLPIGCLAGGDGALLGRLARLVGDIDGFARAIAAPASACAWRVTLLSALERLFDAGLAHAEQVAAVRDALGAMFDAMEEGSGAILLTAPVLRAALAEWLDDPARAGVPGGAVTFAAMNSLRGLPYRLVCLLGMDDGALPSLTRTDEFDLMASFGKVGDRQRRDDERNLFLDLVLAARDHLLIAYTGRSIRDNTRLPPATVVDELLDDLVRQGLPAGAKPADQAALRASLVIEHPLQAFAAAYFDPSAPLGAYDAEQARLAVSLVTSAGRVAPAAPFFRAPLPPLVGEDVSFDDFERFWRHPVRALLSDRLGLGFYNAQAELPDLEPYLDTHGADFAARDALAARVLPTLLDDPSCAAPSPGDLAARRARARRLAQASHELPGGATGAVWRERELEALATFSEQVRAALGPGANASLAARAPALRALPFLLKITPRWPDGIGEPCAGSVPVALNGTLTHVTARGQILFWHARPGAGVYLSAWLRHLAFCAACSDGARRTYWYGNGATFELAPVDAPLTHLAELLALYLSGQRQPLRFFPKSAWAWVVQGRSAAEKAWSGDYAASGLTRAERDDPAWRVALRGGTLELDACAEALAHAVFMPLKRHLRENQA